MCTFLPFYISVIISSISIIRQLRREEHLFVTYNLAKETWKGIVGWWKVSSISITNLPDVINIAHIVPILACLTIFFDAVVKSTLWRFRNDMVFAQKGLTSFSSLAILNSRPSIGFCTGKTKTLQFRSSGFVILVTLCLKTCNPLLASC